MPTSIDASGATDVSKAFGSFVASVPNNATITLRPGARYRMEETLVLANRHGLTVDGNGATIFATTPGDRVRSNIKVIDSSNIAFKDLTVTGANPNAGMSDAAWVVAKEAQHGFDVRSVAGFALSGVTVTDPYGDFVYLGRNEEAQWTSDVTIRDSRFQRNGRMGISMTAATNVIIERNTFGQMRRATFDLEAHHPGFGARYVTIRDNDIGQGRLALVAAVGTGDVSHFTFAGNRVARNLDITMRSDEGAVHQDWKILDNTSSTQAGNPNLTAMAFEYIDGLEIHGNYQRFDTWRPMVGARVDSSCNVNFGGNTYPGAVAQGVLTGTSC